MAKLDLKVIKNPGPTMTWDVEDRTTSSQTTNLLPGEPVKLSTNAAIALATGDPEIGTDILLGIVRKTSTETATVDGKVEVISFMPGQTLIRGKATTAANLDTAAKLYGLMGDYIAIDVTGAGTNGPTGVFTFDEDEGTDPNVHGFMVAGGNTVRGTLDCLVHALASYAAPLVGQTMD